MNDMICLELPVLCSEIIDPSRDESSLDSLATFSSCFIDDDELVGFF